MGFRRTVQFALRRHLSSSCEKPTNKPSKMKYFVIFLLCCVAFAAAAPQFLTYPGYYGGVISPAAVPVARTVVAGPTVVNGFGTRFYPGFY